MIESAGKPRPDRASQEAHPAVSSHALLVERRGAKRVQGGGATSSGSTEALPRVEMRRFPENASRWLWRDGRPRAIVARDRAIVWCNPAARRLLSGSSPLIIRRNHLCAARGVDIEPVDAFLAETGAETARYQVLDAQSERFILLTAWSETVEGAQVSFIEFGMRELPFDCQESGMARAFGLTKAECRVIDAMAVMEPPARIAERLGVSIHTIRTHIRRIYGKLSVRSQIQFLRLTMAYCGG